MEQHIAETVYLDEDLVLKAGKACLYGDVDKDMLHAVHKSFLLRKGKPMHFFLNSGGGDVTAGLAIVNLIEQYKGKVTIEVVGEAESMAAILLQAADLRLMHKYSHLMIHSGHIEPPNGNEKDIQAWFKLNRAQDEMCDAIVLKRIQKKKPNYSWIKFRQEILNDNYFTAAQALEWNLIDRVI